MKAYRHWYEGKQWLRIIPNDGLEYDEPITEWVEVINLITGTLTYRKDKLEIESI